MFNLLTDQNGFRDAVTLHNPVLGNMSNIHLILNIYDKIVTITFFFSTRKSQSLVNMTKDKQFASNQL